jgi:hypothetical protein
VADKVGGEKLVENIPICRVVVVDRFQIAAHQRLVLLRDVLHLHVPSARSGVGGGRDSSELRHQRGPVEDAPALPYLALGKPEDLDDADIHLARGRG